MRPLVTALWMGAALCCFTNPLHAQSTVSGMVGSSLSVPSTLMTSHCIRMSAPGFPAGVPETAVTVTLHVVISKAGTVSPLYMVTGSTRLEDNAMSAVRQWRYRPYERNGQPLAVTTNVDVPFDPHVPAGTVTFPER